MEISSQESDTEPKSVFEHLTDDDWRLLLGGARHESFHRGATIIEEGSLLRAIFVIKEGYVRVKTDQGRGITLALLGPGEVFGEMSFLEQTSASASILAEEDVEVDVIDEAHLRGLLESVSGFATRFYRSLSESLSRRLRNTSQRLCQLKANQLIGPKGSFLAGNLVELGRRPLEFITQCARQYGDIVPLRVWQARACLVSHPEYVDRVLKDRATFVRGANYLALQALLGEGLIVADGNSWLRRRRMVQPVFRQHRLAGYGDLVVTQTQRMLRNWKDGETRDLSRDVAQLTLSVIAKVLFNVDLDAGEAVSITNAMEMISRINWAPRIVLFKISPTLSEWFASRSNIRLRKAGQQMDLTIYQFIKERRTGHAEGQGDLLSMLMQVKDEKDGNQMTDRQLRDEVRTMMVAGHETTANALSWTWVLLSQHQEVQARVLEELHTVLGGRPPAAADLDHLPYTTMVVKESLRLYPPVWMIIRESTQKCEIGGYEIPRGCMVLTSPWVLHRDPRFFQQPDLFAPERWADGLEKRLPRGAYIPFGDGPHLCMGKNFALMEALLILATMASKFKVLPAPHHFTIPRGLATLCPGYGVKVILKKLETNSLCSIPPPPRSSTTR